MKRTNNNHLDDINDAPDLDRLVRDKRSLKRASTAKAHRRNRRYENRIINAQTTTDFEEESLDLEDRE